MLLEDRVAIVTGGARGIGKAIATKFAEEGCSVAIADILEDVAKTTAAEITKKGRETLAVKCDHTNSSQVQEMVDKVIKKFGKIDILVNNAGGSGPPRPADAPRPPAGAPRPGVAEFTEEVWNATIGINLTGPFLCSKYVVPHMKERKSGSIILISSGVAIHTISMATPYVSAKAGVLGLMHSMAFELASYNIRVNAILPDIVETDFYGPPGPERDARLEQQGKYMLMGRVAAPEEIAGPALFLASDLSSYVTGVHIFVGGKYPIGTPGK